MNITSLKIFQKIKGKAKQYLRQNLKRMGIFISEQTVLHRFQHIVMDMTNIRFMLTCVKIQFKDPSKEVGRLLSKRLSNMRLNLK